MVCLVPALVVCVCLLLLLGLGSRDCAAPAQRLLFSWFFGLGQPAFFFCILFWWILHVLCCCYECFCDVFFSAPLAFLVHIVGWCVVSFRQSSGRHFPGGFVALVVLVSSGLFLCGLLHAMLLILRPFLNISRRIVCIAMSLSPLHILASLWRFLLIP